MAEMRDINMRFGMVPGSVIMSGVDAVISSVEMFLSIEKGEAPFSRKGTKINYFISKPMSDIVAEDLQTEILMGLGDLKNISTSRSRVFVKAIPEQNLYKVTFKIFILSIQSFTTFSRVIKRD